MITAPELALLRAADPTAIPGIDTPVGNPLALSALKSPTTITTNTSAPIYYNPAINAVDIKGNGTTPTILNGYNLEGVAVYVLTNNVKIENCTFNDISSGDYAIEQGANATGLTVKNCTFYGGDNVPEMVYILSQVGSTTITGNSFIDTPTHGIQVSGGTVSGNYFSGGGYYTGAHADAITVYDTFNPVSITGNFIDWTNNADALVPTTNAIRITTDNGNTSNVTVSGNIILGGGFSIDAAPTTVLSTYQKNATVGQLGTMTNISIKNNYMGFSVDGPFYPTLGAGVTTSNNTIVDYTNPKYSANAWTAYAANGVGTKYRIESTGASIIGNPAGSTTLYGDGHSVHMYGTAGETVFIGGAGSQDMWGGTGANIYKYLSIGDSPAIAGGGTDLIGNFDASKDVIDLSAIDANILSPGMQNFTFIGTAAFSGAGGQVRYVQNPTLNETLVEADLVGDSSPDLEIRISGLVNLSSANFALTSAQSSAALAAGASLSMTQTGSGAAAHELAYANVQGRPYSSFDKIYSVASTMAAEAFDNTDASGALTLSGAGLTVSNGAAGQTVTTGGTTFSIAQHASQTVNASGSIADTFAFSSGFGQNTISGFDPSTDLLRLQTSMFSYLNGGMSQSADLAAVIAQATILSGGSGLSIGDGSGDTLTLPGVSPAMLAADASRISFV